MFPCFHNVNKARVRYFHAEKLAVNIITFCKTTDECRNENTKALHESWIFSTSLGVWLTVSLAKHVPSLEYIIAQPANKMRDLEVSQPWLYITLSLDCDAVFTDWHAEEESSFFKSVRKFQPELRTRTDFPSGVCWFLPKFLNMEATGFSETMENFYQKPEMEGGISSETTANF